MTMIFNGTTGITFPDGQTQDVGVPDPGTNGNVLTSNGTIWTSAAPGTYSQWTTSGSNIYYNTGNVGVGTSSPDTPLKVVNSSNGVIKVKGGSSTNQGGGFFVEAAGTTNTLAAFGDSARMIGGTPDQTAMIYAAAPLTFYNTAERMRIASNGYVGIGTSSPDEILRINGGTDGASRLRIFNQGSEVGAVGSQLGYFGSGGANDLLLYSPNNTTVGAGGYTAFTSGGGTERMRITSAGDVGIGLTSPTGKLGIYGANISDVPLVITHAWGSSTTALISASNSSGVQFSAQRDGVITVGSGVKFPATQSASSDANTLDDYEEGTWTPTLLGSGGNPTVSSSNVSGGYTKIGNLVTLRCSANFTFTGGSGSARIGGIPFVPGGISIGTLENGGVTMGGSYTWGGTLVAPGDNFIMLRKYSNAAAVETDITIANQASGVWIRFAIEYTV